MCQPGLPKPYSDSHPNSPFSDGFHKTKSAGSFLYSATYTLDPSTISYKFIPDKFPYPDIDETEKRTWPLAK